MAQRVVHGLEVIKVDVHRDIPAIVRDDVEEGHRDLVERAPIAKLGQRVVQGIVFKLLLGYLKFMGTPVVFGDVYVDTDQLVDLMARLARSGQASDIAHVAIGTDHPEIPLELGPFAAEVLGIGDGFGIVVGVQERPPKIVRTGVQAICDAVDLKQAVVPMHQPGCGVEFPDPHARGLNRQL